MNWLSQRKEQNSGIGLCCMRVSIFRGHEQMMRKVMAAPVRRSAGPKRFPLKLFVEVTSVDRPPGISRGQGDSCLVSPMAWRRRLHFSSSASSLDPRRFSLKYISYRPSSIRSPRVNLSSILSSRGTLRRRRRVAAAMLLPLSLFP